MLSTSDSSNDCVTDTDTSNEATKPVIEGLLEGMLLVGDSTGDIVGFGVINTAQIEANEIKSCQKKALLLSEDTSSNPLVSNRSTT